MNKEEKLHFLGNGSAFNPAWGSTSAWFSEGDHFFLLDAGESVFGTLFENGYLKRFSKLTVFITHTHSDHVGSLPSMLSYCFNVLGKKMEVFSPFSELQTLLDYMGIGRELYDFRCGTEVDFGTVQIQAVPVCHAEDIPCFGYRITGAEGTIFYSGDSYKVPEAIVNDFLEGRICRIYQDTAEFPSNHPSHCPLEELERLFPRKDRKRVFCMHFTTEFFEKLEQSGFSWVKLC